MNGATLDHLTPADIAKIQKYADASGATVKLFWSKASGASHLKGIPVGPHSDFDFLIEGANSKWMKRALDPRSGYSLPKGGAGGQIERGFESGIDLWRPEDFIRRNWTLDDRPYIIFTPKPK